MDLLTLLLIAFVASAPLVLCTVIVCNTLKEITDKKIEYDRIKTAYEQQAKEKDTKQ